MPAMGEPFEHLVDQCRPTVERRICEPVLVLRPVVSCPFEARFGGPFVVQCKLSENYEIITPSQEKSVKRYHVNLLKPHYETKIDPVESETSVHPILSAASTDGKVVLGGRKRRQFRLLMAFFRKKY